MKHSFVNRTIVKIDAKGRMSVPAGWRNTIAKQNGDDAAEALGIFIYPSLNVDAPPHIEGGGLAWRSTIQEMIDAYPPYSEESDVLNGAYFGAGDYLYFDKEGRVSLPPAMLAHIGADKELYLIGVGQKFQIWHPEAGVSYYDEEKRRARASVLQKKLGAPPKPLKGDA